MGARYYQSGTGRFTQVDPLGRSVYEANRYAYANCNPSNKVDPTGLLEMTGECLDFIVAAAGVLANFLMPGGGFLVEKGLEGVVKTFLSTWDITYGTASLIEQGDTFDAALSFASALVSWIPGIGQTTAAVIDAVLAIESLAGCIMSQF